MLRPRVPFSQAPGGGPGGPMPINTSQPPPLMSINMNAQPPPTVCVSYAMLSWILMYQLFFFSPRHQVCRSTSACIV